jgi:hypothetical protein
MSSTYTYVGEGEQVLPFTVEGPKVVEHGDEVTVPDGALDGHPLFEPVKAGGSSGSAVPAAQAGSQTAVPVEKPGPSAPVESVAEPVPAPVEPTA